MDACLFGCFRRHYAQEKLQGEESLGVRASSLCGIFYTCYYFNVLLSHCCFLYVLLFDRYFLIVLLFYRVIISCVVIYTCCYFMGLDGSLFMRLKVKAESLKNRNYILTRMDVRKLGKRRVKRFTSDKSETVKCLETSDLNGGVGGVCGADSIYI